MSWSHCPIVSALIKNDTPKLQVHWWFCGVCYEERVWGELCIIITMSHQKPASLVFNLWTALQAYISPSLHCSIAPSQYCSIITPLSVYFSFFLSIFLQRLLFICTVKKVYRRCVQTYWRVCLSVHSEAPWQHIRGGLPLLGLWLVSYYITHVHCFST